MSEPPTSPPNAPHAGLKIGLLALAVVALLVIALSFGGFVFWLVMKRSAPAAGNGPEQVPAGPHVAGAPETGFTELFNGTDLEGWDFDPAVWSVRDGVIHGNKQRSGVGSCLFWRDSDVADFELRFRFRLIRGNSGVAYRGTRLAGFDAGGYEFEIYTNKTGNLANVGTDRQRYRLHRADDTAPPTDSEWHEAVIIAQGTRLVHVVDGKTLCDVQDTNPAALHTGLIAFGVGGETAAEFKDIRLKKRKK
jgi:hypothetical protein